MVLFHFLIYLFFYSARLLIAIRTEITDNVDISTTEKNGKIYKLIKPIFYNVIK